MPTIQGAFAPQSPTDQILQIKSLDKEKKAGSELRDIDEVILYEEIDEIKKYLNIRNGMTRDEKLELKKRVDTYNDGRYYPIHYAYQRAMDTGDCEVLRLLLSDPVNADPNPVHPDHQVPILLIAELYTFKQLEKDILNCFLQSSKNVKLKFAFDKSQRFTGRPASDTASTGAITRRTMSTDQSSTKKIVYNSALHIAASGNSNLHIDLIINYIKKHRITHFDSGINLRDESGRTPIYYAIRNSNYDMAKLLSKNGAKLSIDNESEALNLLAEQSDNDASIKKFLFKQLLKTQSEDGYLPDLVHLFSPDPTSQPSTEANASNVVSFDSEDVNEQTIRFLEETADWEIVVTGTAMDLLLEKSNEERKDLIQNRPILFKNLVENFFKYVMLRENEKQFRRMVHHGQWLWAKIQLFLEERISVLYDSVVAKSDCVCMRKTGFAEAADTEGRLKRCFDSFAASSYGRDKFLPSRQQVSSIPEDEISDFLRLKLSDQMSHPKRINKYNKYQNPCCTGTPTKSKGDADTTGETVPLQPLGKDSHKSPMKSLLLWSIFCGKWRLTKYLLYSTDFHSIPLTLVAIKVLEKMVDIQCLHYETFVALLDLCESRVRSLVDDCFELEDRCDDFCISQFLGRRMAEYADFSCVDLAARCSNKNIFGSKAFQCALKKRLFGVFSTRPWGEFCVDVILGFFYIPLLIYVKVLRKKKVLDVPCDDISITREDTPPVSLSNVNVAEASSSATLKAAGADDAITTLPKQSSFRAARDDYRLGGLFASPQASEDVTDAGKRKRSGVASTKSQDSSVLSNYALDEISVRDFYRTPFVKIFYHGLSHIIFFILTAYIIANEDGYWNYAECVMFLYVLGLLAEELAEINNHRKDGTIKSEYIRNLWNWLDWLILISFMVCAALRLSELVRHLLYDGIEDSSMLNETAWNGTSRLPLVSISEATTYRLIHTAMHFFRSFGLLLFGMRLLYLCFLSKHTGPKLYISYLMLKNDLVPTLLILLIIFCSFGVFIEGVLWPSHKGWNFIFSLFNVAFYAIFGEYNIESVAPEFDSSSALPRDASDTYSKGFVFLIALPFYVIFTQLLIINLIIAQFTKTIEDHSKASESLWHMRRYLLIVEIESHSNLPPPFNILEILSRRCHFCLPVLPRLAEVEKARKEKKHNLSLWFQFFLALALRKERRKQLSSQIQLSQETRAAL